MLPAPHLDRILFLGDDKPAMPQERYLQELLLGLDKVIEMAFSEQDKQGKGLQIFVWDPEAQRSRATYCPLSKLSEGTFLELGLSGRVFLDVIDDVQNFRPCSYVPLLALEAGGDYLLSGVGVPPAGAIL
jgi:hypothetical protein